MTDPTPADPHHRRHNRCGLGDPDMCGHPDCPDMVTPAEPDAGDVEALTADQRHAILNAVPRYPGDPAVQSGDARRLLAEVERIAAEVRRATAEQIAQAIENHAANCGRTGPHHTTFATAARIVRYEGAR
jgi:hypothetical protein